MCLLRLCWVLYLVVLERVCFCGTTVWVMEGIWYVTFMTDTDYLYSKLMVVVKKVAICAVEYTVECPGAIRGRDGNARYPECVGAYGCTMSVFKCAYAYVETGPTSSVTRGVTECEACCHSEEEPDRCLFGCDYVGYGADLVWVYAGISMDRLSFPLKVLGCLLSRCRTVVCLCVLTALRKRCVEFSLPNVVNLCLRKPRRLLRLVDVVGLWVSCRMVQMTGPCMTDLSL